MQKKIIALAVAAALTAPVAAFAEANVYGLVDLSIDMVNDGRVVDPATGNKVSTTTTNQLVSNVSRVGVKGSEDLGGGLSAVWQMEGEVGMDTGAFGGFNRNTYIGLASADMGKVILGRHDVPYKMATRKLDVFADSAADNRKLMGFGVMDARLSNVIAYVSPNLSGLTIAAASEMGAELAAQTNPGAAPGTGAVTPTKGSALSLAGMYTMDAIYATAAYQTIKFGSAGTGDLAAGGLAKFAAVDDKATSIKLGGGYTMDQITVNAIFESNTFSSAAVGATPASEYKVTNLYLAGKFALSATDAVKVAYTMKGEGKVDGAGQNDKASQIALGYDHDMSKNTTVYAMYTKVTDDGTVNQTTGGAGIPGANQVAGSNADPSVISVGIKHSF